MVVHSSDSSLHSGSDEGFDCHFRRIYLARFGNGRISQSVVFWIWKTVTAFYVWIASNVKRFYNAFPHQASVKYFYDWRRGDMSRHAPDVFLHSALNVKDSLCHAQPSARGASCPEHLKDATGQWPVITEYASQRERATFEGIRIPRSFYEAKS